MKIDPCCQQRNCSPLNVLFSDVQNNFVDMASRFFAKRRQTTLMLQKQVFVHTRLSRAYLALARLCCWLVDIVHKFFRLIADEI